jgi:hypothetical protein
MKTYTLSLILLMIFGACSKSNSSSDASQVEYQVTATNSTGITVAYNNENEQYVSGSYQSGWTYKFTTTKKPFTTNVRALPYNTINISANISVTVKILVNGNIVKTETATGTGSADVEAQYIIQ